ncbi:LysR substrate-binding domain-containing protein [Phenylobacterium sp. LjRoot219]|uniref:LysR substrate-binding domain-containing protein n=1 Tax=Phenylobacterium sp. LjRoot219 TaxID=3342283 RepID=UPI003ED174C5
MSQSLATSDRIPAVQSLRALEASIRLRSLTRAAEELGVTPSAITQHVRAVETWVGMPLFRRSGRQIIPTDAAEAAMPSLREGFDRIVEGAQLLKGADRKGRVISISTTPAFASKWLLPRLDRFRAQNPQIEVWVSSDMKLADFSTADIDLAIRYGPGGYDGLVAEQILAEAVTPMAAPDLAAELAVRGAADLLQARLLHDTSSEGDPSCPSWRSWFRTRGVDDLRTLDGPRYSDASLVIEEAIAGKGVALVKRTLADQDVRAGRLTPLLLDVTPVKFVYWLVWPRGRTLLPPVRAFIAWIKAEALGDIADGAGI